MTKIDLDAARAARREAAGDPPILTVDGKDYKLAVELPALLLSDIAIATDYPEEGATPEQKAELAGILTQLAKAALGESWEELRLRLSVTDLMTILEELAPYYGFQSPGESSASAASS